MIWLVGICGVMLFISAILVLWRINDGPNTLDRMVGVDVMTSIMLGALALLVAATRRSDLLAVFVVSVVGFLGSVAVARAARPDDPGKRRILTIEEERAIAAAEEAAEEIEDEDSIAPVHPDGSEEDSDDYSS